METKPTSIFSGIILIRQEGGLVERATRKVFSEPHDLSLEDFRRTVQPHALLVPKEVRTTPHWEGHYQVEALQSLDFTLPKTKADFSTVLRKLKRIAQTMVVLHRHNLGLGLLTPARLWQNEGGALNILGFQLVRPWTEIPNLLHLTIKDLAFVPPEYSDQIAQIPDHRADFYSLGVLLYRWLTGVLPFAGEDALEIIHQHLSRTAVNPGQLNPKIPPMLEAMTMALLEKDPDNRYQSAEGLLEDIERITEHDFGRTGFTLRKAYSPGILQIKNTLYGRDGELRSLKTAFETTRKGREQFIHIGGYSGVGKTALVQALQKELHAEAHFFIQGKFDQYQNTSYAAWITALEQLVHQLLFMPEVEMNQWKATILEELGENGGVLVEVIPNLELLVDKQPSPEKLSPVETQNRFSYVFLQFCKLFARPGHPLVLFLDDWQWCDIPSIQLLKQLLEADLHYLMVVAAYRNNEIHEGHPFSMLLKELEQSEVAMHQLILKNLNEAQVNELISEALGESSGYTKRLAALILKKTDGNAFFTRQFLLSLRERALLTFNHQNKHWQWKEGQILREDVSDNVLELMAGKIANLSEPAQWLLKIAAFVGSNFNSPLLSIVSGLDHATCRKHIKEAEKQGLIIHLKKIAFGENGHYGFVHDRVQQAAYALALPDFQHDDAALHYLIGKTLLRSGAFSHIPPREKGLHFLKALDLVESDLRPEVITLLMEAGARANESNSPDAAHDYYQAAKTLSEEGESQELEILKGLMQAGFLRNDVAVAEDYAAQAIAMAPTLIAKSEVYVLRLMFYESLALFEKNIYTGIEALKLFDIDIEKALNMAAMESLVQQLYYDFQSLMKDKRPSDFLRMPVIDDAEQAALLDILVNMNASAYFVDLYLFAWCTLRMGNQTLRYGKADSTPFAFVFLGSLLVTLYQQFELGYRFGKTGIEMLDQLDSNRYRCRTLSIFTIFIQHFKEPLLNGIPVLKESVRAGLETGDFPYAGYSKYAQVRDKFLACDNLNEVMDTIRSSIEFMEKVNNAGLLALMKLFRANLKLLVGGYDERVAEEEKECLNFLLEIKFFTAVAHHYIFKSWALCILNRFEEAWKYLEKNKTTLIYASSQPHVPKFYFLQSLILLKTKGELTEEEQTKVAENQKVLHAWSVSMPDNFSAEYELIKALQACRTDAWTEVLTHLDAAMAQAKKGGLRGVEAMANEIAGDIMDANDLTNLAGSYDAKAFQLYAAWGATEKVKLLGNIHLLDSKSTNVEPVLDYDTRSLLKATQAISAEVSKEGLVRNLLQIVMENAGAEKGVLVLHENDDYFVEAEINLRTHTVKTLRQQVLSQSKAVPQQLIQYVIKTKKEIVFDRPRQFAQMKDAYFDTHPAKSVLALPIQSQQELIGVLYLENDHLSGVFHENKLEMLRAIASQTAISVANTRLFEQTNRLNERLLASQEELRKMNELLEERIRDRTKVLREEIENRKSMELQLKHAKETADSANLAKSRFLANMSHEIRSPLNAIVGFSQILINQSRKLELPSEFKKYLHNIKISGQNLSELINDILDLSKIEAGKMTLSEEDMNLKQLVQSIYHIHKATAKEKGITLHYDFAPATPQYMRSDRGKIKQILMNLLSNAIKFTPAGKNIFLRTDFQSGAVGLEVADEGIGISEEKQAAIFHPFVQADTSVTREYQGTGLGLAITRNMVEMLGGHIEVESELGRGATFLVTIPYQEPEHITTEQSEIMLDKIEIPANVRILVVEDNPMNQEMIKAFFNEMNHDILVAHNGAEGVEMAGQFKPDLIFMDIHMPGMDGFEAMQRIRKKDGETPIVALSADAFSEQQKRAIRAGFTDYITKPIQVTRVIECLQKYLIKGEIQEDIPVKTLSEKEKAGLESVLQQLEQTPIYETEKLVELLESTAGLTQAAWREAVLNAVYTVDENKLAALIDEIKNQ